MFTRLEDLPNELFFIIFTYFNGLDLCLAFSHLNTHINQLLDNVAHHQSLDLTSGSISYKAFRAYIDDKYNVRSSFISSLKFDCLSLSPPGIKDLFSSLIDKSIGNRLQRLTITTSEFSSVEPTEIITLLEYMMIANKQGPGRLEHLTLNFENCRDYNLKIFITIVQRHISFSTMIFNVSPYTIKPALSRKMFTLTDETNLHIQIDARPLLINTVRLSLSLLFCSDLVLLLQRGVLPLLQQLNVIFQRQNPHAEHHTIRFRVDEDNLLRTDTNRLRTFSLRNLPMEYALRFIRFLRLPQLETLCLINIFDESLTRITEFERAITIRLYNIVTLQFTLHFPIHIFSHHSGTQWTEDLAILQNDIWQSRGWYVRDHLDIDQKTFIIYTIPYALSNDCTLRNHTFIAAQQPDFADLKTHQPLIWTCTNSSPLPVAQSWKGLRQARYLQWDFQNRMSPLVLPSTNNIDFIPLWSTMKLRSLCLFMSSQIPIEDRSNMITRILFVCSHLRMLAVFSQGLALCLKQKPAFILSSLDHLHLYLDRVDEIPDPVTLVAVFPNISYFSTGKVYLQIDTKLCWMVLDLIKALPYLHRLYFNDCKFCYNCDTNEYCDNLVQMLQNSEQLRSVDCFVRAHGYKHLFIWF